MPRSTDTRWLEKHGGQWRVTVAVPRALHKTLGTRLKRPLHTDSLAVASRLKFQAVAELRARIEQARELAGGKPRAVIREAIELNTVSALQRLTSTRSSMKRLWNGLMISSVWKSGRRSTKQPAKVIRFTIPSVRHQLFDPMV
jgi:hypothetical protein